MIGVSSLLAWLGCGGSTVTPPADAEAAVKALVGDAEVAWFDSGEAKPQGALVSAAVRDGAVIALAVHVPVVDVGALASFPSLERLTLTDAGWTGPLACGSLRSLTVKRNPGFDVAWLAGCAGLTHLELLDSGLTNVDGFPVLPELQRLHLGKNPIATLAGLPTLPKLEQITLQGFEPGAEETIPTQPALKRVITPGVTTASATDPKPGAAGESTPSPFGRNDVLGIDIPPPKNPWVPKITARKGSTSGIDKACTVNHLGKFEIDCRFGIETLTGMVPLKVDIGSTHHEPGVIADVSVTAGTVRVYMPYHTVQQYAEATPGNPVRVHGILDKSWTSAGKLGEHHIVVEAQGGPAEGVEVKLKNAI